MEHLQEGFSKAMSFFNSGQPICLECVTNSLMAHKRSLLAEMAADLPSRCLSDKTIQAMGIIPKASLLHRLERYISMLP